MTKKTLEKWKPITKYQSHKFDGSYEVSNWGRIRKVGTDYIVPPYSDNRGQGYMRVKLFDTEHRRTAIKIHRLVAYNFVEPGRADQTEVNHKDGNPKNNSWTNLEWCNRKENMQHSSRGRAACE